MALTIKWTLKIDLIIHSLSQRGPVQREVQMDLWRSRGLLETASP